MQKNDDKKGMVMNIKPIMLVILDGLGYSAKKEHNALFYAHTPYLDTWQKLYPHTYIHASGSYVGLPPTAIGNSEVGHLTIGTGRVIEQPLTTLNRSIKDGTLYENAILHEKLQILAESGGALHIIGLLSDVGVHAHIDHIVFYVGCAAHYGIKRIYVHAILDGRDVVPYSAYRYLEQFEMAVKKYHATLASIQGRFFAMDRDNNWERTIESYQMLTEQVSVKRTSWRRVLDDCYTDGISDEFIPPTQLDPLGYIQDGDGIIFANVRPDRARQLTTCFIHPERVPKTLVIVETAFFITPVMYAENLETDALLPMHHIKHTLKQELDAAGKTMLSVAETEKYAHVTYFFNGQQEQPLPGEERILIKSRKLHDYRQCPEMSAADITRALVKTIQYNPKDFYLVNYANADMVAHSGDPAATVKAIEILDEQLGILYHHFVQEMDGMMIITADHGNAEDMFDENTQQPNTAHTCNPVLFMCVTRDLKESPDISAVTQLADIAPFILKHMGLEVPEEMQKNLRD